MSSMRRSTGISSVCELNVCITPNASVQLCRQPLSSAHQNMPFRYCKAAAVNDPLIPYAHVRHKECSQVPSKNDLSQQCTWDALMSKCTIGVSDASWMACSPLAASRDMEITSRVVRAVVRRHISSSRSLEHASVTIVVLQPPRRSTTCGLSLV